MTETLTESPVHQAQRLAKKLLAYRNANAVVTATSSGALPIASELATELQLPVDKHYCKAVKHPGNPHKTIGSITAEHVVLDNATFTMPRDYIQHQIIMLQHSILAEDQNSHSYREKHVILLRDELNNPDEVAAVIDHVRLQEAAAIIMATPVINREALTYVERLVSEVVYLDVRHHTGLWLSPYCF